MNCINLIGNLTKDPEFKNVGANNTPWCRFSIAVNRKFADANGERVADFFNIVCWRGLAENCGKYLAKGSKVGITGEVQNRTYEHEGVKRAVSEIIASAVDFIKTDNKTQHWATGDESGALEDGMTPVNDSNLPF